MNLSDEQKRTIRAMQVLGLSFPPDLKRTAETIEQLPVEYMLRIRSMYKDQFTVYNRLFDSLSERIKFTYCDVCDEQQSSYDDLPDGWGWYDGQVRWYVMCTDCQIRFTEKFKHEPKIVRDIEDIL